MSGGAWPFLVGGVICLVNSVNERDLNLLNSYLNLIFKIKCLKNFLEGLFTERVNGSLRQKQVCDALRCSGPHARYTDISSEFFFLGRKVMGNLVKLCRAGDRAL